jgi:hypothetical protein
MCVACGRKYRSSQVQPKQALAQKGSSVGASSKVALKERIPIARPILKYPKWKVRVISASQKQGG